VSIKITNSSIIKTNPLSKLVSEKPSNVSSKITNSSIIKTNPLATLASRNTLKKSIDNGSHRKTRKGKSTHRKTRKARKI
jgi:hypothetical protein